MHFDWIDQTGRNIRLARVPKRIVSLVPSLTELLCDLGLEADIVGITKFCVHPARLRSAKTVVGGTKKVNVEKIAALVPDIIICNKEENTLEIVESLESIAPVWVTDIVTLSHNTQMIDDFGRLFNKRTEARQLIGKIEFAQQEFTRFMQDRPARKTAYFIWKNPWMAAGADTFIDTMLALNRFTNVYAARGRYPEVEIRKLRIQGDPDLVLLSSEPFPFKEEDAFEVGRCTHHAKVVFVDGEFFSWYGSRVVKAFNYFKSLQARLGED